MKLQVSKNQLREHPEHFLRRAGFGFIRDGRSGQESFVRRLGLNHYPRLHLYVEDRGNSVIFNLHIDQSQSRYGGGHNHGSEYDGPVVENEIARLRGLLNESVPVIIENIGSDSSINANDSGNYLSDTKKVQPKKKWWQKIFVM